MSEPTPSTETLNRLPLHELEDLYMDVASALFLRRNRDSNSAKLALMKIGDSYIFAGWTSTNQLQSADKRNARKRMSDTTAQWTARTTNRGIRVTRVR